MWFITLEWFGYIPTKVSQTLKEDKSYSLSDSGHSVDVDVDVDVDLDVVAAAGGGGVFSFWNAGIVGLMTTGMYAGSR